MDVPNPKEGTHKTGREGGRESGQPRGRGLLPAGVAGVWPAEDSPSGPALGGPVRAGLGAIVSCTFPHPIHTGTWNTRILGWPRPAPHLVPFEGVWPGAHPAEWLAGAPGSMWRNLAAPHSTSSSARGWGSA